MKLMHSREDVLQATMNSNIAQIDIKSIKMDTSVSGLIDQSAFFFAIEIVQRFLSLERVTLVGKVT